MHALVRLSACLTPRMLQANDNHFTQEPFEERAHALNMSSRIWLTRLVWSAVWG